MRRVVVTGLGALTPLGNNLHDYWEGLKEWCKWICNDNPF